MDAGHLFVDELNGYCHGAYRKEKYRDLPSTRYGMPVEEDRITFDPADNIHPTSRVISDLMLDANYPDGNAGKNVVSSLVAMWESVDSGNSTVTVSKLGNKVKRKLPWA